MSVKILWSSSTNNIDYRMIPIISGKSNLLNKIFGINSAYLTWYKVDRNSFLKKQSAREFFLIPRKALRQIRQNKNKTRIYATSLFLLAFKIGVNEFFMLGY